MSPLPTLSLDVCILLDALSWNAIRIKLGGNIYIY